ncbi:MAG: hypothetical protein ACQEQF_00125 [Bacillota bacterium]
MKFKELAKVKIGENRNLVISRRSDGKISVAQQIVAESDGQVIKFFVKNAIQTDRDGLKNIMSACNEALANDNVEDEKRKI